MESLINRILKIQNKHQSLMWGHNIISDEEALFAVRHKEYPKATQYFIVQSYNIFFISNEHKKYLHKECANEQESVACIIELLKDWFLAKNI